MRRAERAGIKVKRRNRLRRKPAPGGERIRFRTLVTLPLKSDDPATTVSSREGLPENRLAATVAARQDVERIRSATWVLYQ